MDKKVTLIKDNSVTRHQLLVYACDMLDLEEPTEEIEQLVQKTVDKFKNECYNLYRKER